MRSTSFVDRLTLEIGGDIAKHGLCLADVNSDGDFELVVGTDNGDLLIFKGAVKSQPSFTILIKSCCVQVILAFPGGSHQALGSSVR